MPNSRATDSAVRSIVAGAHDDFEADGDEAARIAVVVVGLMGSAMPRTPDYAPIYCDEHNVVSACSCRASACLE